jgi:hypothetical protein
MAMAVRAVTAAAKSFRHPSTMGLKHVERVAWLIPCALIPLLLLAPKTGRLPAPDSTTRRSWRSALRLLNKYVKKIRRAAQAGKARRSEQSLRALILERGLFDPQFYVEQYPDVAQWTTGALDPLAHYIRYGGAEGRNPSADFDAQFYLATNADVRNARLNPLVHYLQHGEAEGRLVRQVNGPGPRSAAGGAGNSRMGRTGRRPRRAAHGLARCRYRHPGVPGFGRNGELPLYGAAQPACRRP